MVLDRAYMKGGYNVNLSRDWRNKAERAILDARTQAVIPTLGERREVLGSGGILTNVTYNQQSGLFTLTMGR